MGSLPCSRRVVPGEMLTFLKECLVAGCVRGNFWLSRYYVEVLEVCALSSSHFLSLCGRRCLLLCFFRCRPRTARHCSPRTVSVRTVSFVGEIDSQGVVAFVFGPETVSPAGCLRRCFVLRAFVAFLSTSNAEAERTRHGCTVEHTDPPFFVPANIFMT